MQFVTGPDVSGELPTDLNMAALADPEATTVIFMGKRTLPRLVDMLAENGLPSDTPAILADNVSRPDQKVTRGTLKSLAELLSGEIGKNPALILYGPLAEFADD